MPKQIFVKALPMLLGLACLGPLLFSHKTALAANPATINFQGKVVNSNGTNVSNGNYTFIFRLYDSSSASNISTNCSDNSHCWWEETQTNVSVTNGVFQVELGSVCSFASACNSTHSGINWSSNNALYLTMQFNGDTSGSYHGFMTPLIHLTSVPYAFQADNASSLGGIAAGSYVQLAPALQQSGGININGTVQAPYFGVATTGAALGIGTTNAGIVTQGNVANSTFIFQAKTSSTAFQFQNSNNKNVITIDTSGNQLILGTPGASGISGSIMFDNSAGSGTATITLAGNPSTNYTYQLPTGTVGSNQCLQSGSVSSGTVPLSFGTCSTLASAYNTSSTTGNIIGLTQNGGGVIIQDASTPLTPTGTNLFAVQKNGGTVTYLGVSATGINIQSNYTGSAVTALVFDTSAATPHLRIYGSNGTSYADIYYNTSTSTAYYGASSGTAVLGNGTGNVSVNAGSGYGFTITGHAASSISTDSGALSLDGIGGLDLGTSTATILIGQTSGGSTQVQSANGLIIGTASVAGQLAIYNGSNSVTIKAGSSTTAYNLVLPASSGTNNYCLVNTSTPGTLQWQACGAGSTAKVVLTPEFVGAVMTPVSLTGWTNSGTMTSDFCSGSSLLNVAPSPNPCGASDQHSYYAWTASSNCVNYDIWVNWSVPNDFSSFPSSNNSFNAWKTGNSTSCNSVSGNDDVKVNVYTAGATSTCASQSMTNTSGSWQNTAINMSGCSPSAGSILTFDIQLKVNTSGDYARIGEITLDYNRM